MADENDEEAEAENVNAPVNFLAETALHVAASGQMLARCRELIERGAFVNAKNKDGWSPLHCASINENPDVCTLLLANGADVHARTFSGMTPLMLAVKYARIQPLEVLLNYGANVYDRDEEGLYVFEMVTDNKIYERLCRHVERLKAQSPTNIETTDELSVSEAFVSAEFGPEPQTQVESKCIDETSTSQFKFKIRLFVQSRKQRPRRRYTIEKMSPLRSSSLDASKRLDKTMSVAVESDNCPMEIENAEAVDESKPATVAEKTKAVDEASKSSTIEDPTKAPTRNEEDDDGAMDLEETVASKRVAEADVDLNKRTPAADDVLDASTQLPPSGRATSSCVRGRKSTRSAQGDAGGHGASAPTPATDATNEQGGGQSTTDRQQSESAQCATDGEGPNAAAGAGRPAVDRRKTDTIDEGSCKSEVPATDSADAMGDAADCAMLSIKTALLGESSRSADEETNKHPVAELMSKMSNLTPEEFNYCLQLLLIDSWDQAQSNPTVRNIPPLPGLREFKNLSSDNDITCSLEMNVAKKKPPDFLVGRWRQLYVDQEEERVEFLRTVQLERAELRWSFERKAAIIYNILNGSLSDMTVDRALRERTIVNPSLLLRNLPYRSFMLQFNPRKDACPYSLLDLLVTAKMAKEKLIRKHDLRAVVIYMEQKERWVRYKGPPGHSDADLAQVVYRVNVCDDFEVLPEAFAKSVRHFEATVVRMAKSSVGPFP